MTFYEEIAKLKNTLRKGWVVRNVSEKCGRVESDAEHTFSMIMLALEIMNKRKLNLNQEKVLKMIAYHKLCEIDYGDHTLMDNISKQEKYQNELKCIKRLAEQYQMPELLDYWKEFEENKTPEARFVKKIDKLDAIMQSRIYAKTGNMPELFETFKNYNIEVYNEFKDEEEKDL